MAEHAIVIRVSHFQPASGKREQLVEQLEALSATIRSMDGCFGVQVCSIREAPEPVVVVSRWANQAALDRLMQSGTVKHG